MDDIRKFNPYRVVIVIVVVKYATSNLWFVL
jgi:hypothetical protein